MSVELCPIQDICPHYTNGTKRKVHHIRITEPCKKTLDYSCSMYVDIRNFIGKPIACNLEKIRRIKGELNA